MSQSCHRHLLFLSPQVTLNHGRPVPAVLLANKSDQLASQQPKLDSFCRENGFVGWFETSAKVRKRSFEQTKSTYSLISPNTVDFSADIAQEYQSSEDKRINHIITGRLRV